MKISLVLQTRRLPRQGDLLWNEKVILRLTTLHRRHVSDEDVDQESNDVVRTFFVAQYNRDWRHLINEETPSSGESVATDLMPPTVPELEHYPRNSCDLHLNFEKSRFLLQERSSSWPCFGSSGR